VRGLRIAAALTGLGALFTCSSVRAYVLPDPASDEPVAERSAPALALLHASASAAQEQTWTGTERVLSLVSGSPVVTVTSVQHGPGQPTATDALDARLFSLLATHYELRITGRKACGDRTAQVVEARRPGRDGHVAGRFWVDADSGLMLRREVLDDAGALLRRTDLLGIRVGSRGGTVTTALTPAAPAGERLDAAALSAFEADGWPVVRVLPGDLDLYDARWLSDGVLQLAYSDGLSTLSLFLQRGELPPTTTGVVRRVGGGTVWESSGEPERAIWAADGLTWTLVADVAPSLVDEVILALPHASHHVSEDGLAPRVWRGMARVGAWLNPFD
jgi:sigma-E factor negative regulatory protein RseB